MVEDEEVVEAPLSYTGHFNQHSTQFRAHLHGHTEDAAPSNVLGFNAAETDAFFHALSIYSRWRPDLIADSIPGKSVLSICSYIDALDEASRSLDPSSSVFLSRDAFEYALETPDDLLKLEEEHAAKINQYELGRDEGEEERAKFFASLDKTHFQAIDHIISLHTDNTDIPLPSTSTSLPDAEAEDEDDLSRYSPATRRRIRKRIHMRKKRASDAGEAVDLSATLKKRGRPKREPKQKTTATGGRIRAAGKTKYERIKEKLEEWGIDGEYLAANGLGLFRLKGLESIMSSEDDAPSAISPDTIRVLNKFVLDFVRSVFLHIVVYKDQEIALKGNTKIWRLGENNEITTDDVSHALEMVGFSLTEEVETQDPEEDEEEDNDDVEPMNLDATAEQTTFSLPENVFPLSRETLPPFFRPTPFEDSIDIDLEDDEDALMEELDEEYELEIKDEDTEKELNDQFSNILNQ